MPSSISTPNRSVNRSSRSAGNASPALTTQPHAGERVGRAGRRPAGPRSRWAPAKNSVGRCSCSTRQLPAGLGRDAVQDRRARRPRTGTSACCPGRRRRRTWPTEKQTSSGPMASTSRAVGVGRVAQRAVPVHGRPWACRWCPRCTARRPGSRAASGRRVARPRPGRPAPAAARNPRSVLTRAPDWARRGTSSGARSSVSPATTTSRRPGRPADAAASAGELGADRDQRGPGCRWPA